MQKETKDSVVNGTEGVEELNCKPNEGRISSLSINKVINRFGISSAASILFCLLYSWPWTFSSVYGHINNK